MFEKTDIDKLLKLNVQNILDLALIIPSSYNDTFISNTPQINSENVVDCIIKSSIVTGKILKVQLFSYNFNQNIEAVFFNYKPYHLGVFKKEKKLYLKGKVEYQNRLVLIQPQVVNEINTIEVKYKTPLQNRTVATLMKKYIKEEYLSFLPQRVIKEIIEIHNPPKHFEIEQNIYSIKFIELYNYLTKLNKKKLEFESIAKLNSSPQSFIKSLPFKLTSDQDQAIKDIQKDLQSQKSAKRVIMGDVGSGKTIVILASVVIAYPYKSVLMAPTTILANQLYSEAQKYLPQQIKTVLVTNKTKQIDLNEFDFIIGTHALLYRDLPQFALVMIDEQHRFGTNQRNDLEKFSQNSDKRAHFLQFTATPIPRTMAMVESNFLDFSFLRQTPFKKDIDTYIIHQNDFPELINHIKEEIAHQRQVIIVYPLVNQSEFIDYQSIDEGSNYWLNNFENVYITHGKDKEKEEVLQEFSQKGNILLATTVIEVGISLPKLSTIVIVGAERLGLASLHQLRGRVSRNGLKGYCYLFTKQSQSERLEEFSKTTNGFEIAELDLKYRDSGDLLSGVNQSGKQFNWFNFSEDEDIILDVKKIL